LYPAFVFTAFNVLENDVSDEIRWSFSAHELMIVDNGCSSKKHWNKREDLT
jgi:hypothetical protein